MYNDVQFIISISKEDINKPIAPVFNLANTEIRKTQNTQYKNAFEIEIDQLPSKPWNAASADLSDYFNYELNEESWKVSIIVYLGI